MASDLLPHLPHLHPSALAAVIHGLTHLGEPGGVLPPEWLYRFDSEFRARQAGFTPAEMASVLVSYYQLGSLSEGSGSSSETHHESTNGVAAQSLGTRGSSAL